MLLLLLIFGLASGGAWAQTKPDSPQLARLEFPGVSDYLLIEYTVRHDGLEENDPVPLLRIQGDGAVKVHIPRYMRGAGDFRMTLSSEELEALLRSLERQGVMAFDRERVNEGKRLAEEARFAREQSEVHVSDTSWTVLGVHLSLYDPEGNGLVRTGLDREITWPNVEWQARQYPEVAALQGLAAAERELRALLVDPRLTPLEVSK